MASVYGIETQPNKLGNNLDANNAYLVPSSRSTLWLLPTAFDFVLASRQMLWHPPNRRHLLKPFLGLIHLMNSKVCIATRIFLVWIQFYQPNWYRFLKFQLLPGRMYPLTRAYGYSRRSLPPMKQLSYQLVYLFLFNSILIISFSINPTLKHLESKI